MNLKQPLTLSDEFKAVIDQLEHTKDNLFITGRAGTGKSTLLQLFRNTTRKVSAVLAPTGIAALNVKGQTLHSFFGFPPKMINRYDIQRRKNWRMYTKLDIIIIDEISMVRADMLDNIDIFLRVNRNVDAPFGGVQMVFFGDLFQLPPVIASDFEKRHFVTHYESPYFFSADIVTKTDFEFSMIELHQVFRQDERKFINLLDSIRLNHFDYDDMEELNERVVDLPDDAAYYITLTSRNKTAEEINTEEINKLTSEPFTYTANLTGMFNPRLFPTDPVLKLKVGSQVMFLKNDLQKRFVNGSIGIVRDLTPNKIVVSVLDGYEDTKTFELEKWEWEIIKYSNDPANPRSISTDTVGTFKQYPVKLAWAITIHKSQGKTFDKVIIDLGGGAFEYGQTYVALSRCRTFDGIILKRPIRPQDIKVDERVRDFYETKRYYS
ncbi:MAG: ATP-dependent DNA helicase PIF1 [Saprospiraceae bacterium]|jgi:ATP-dependent exoDNAse (exonuclease V) alpha subunit